MKIKVQWNETDLIVSCYEEEFDIRDGVEVTNDFIIDLIKENYTTGNFFDRVEYDEISIPEDLKETFPIKIEKWETLNSKEIEQKKVIKQKIESLKNNIKNSENELFMMIVEHPNYKTY